MRWSGPAVGLLSLAAVVAYAMHEADRPAPGPLHPSHAAVAELADCAVCHDGDAEWSQRCGACHEPIVRQMDTRRGLHGVLGADAGACARCHVEHHGATVPLVGDASFGAAGIASRAAFDHERDTGLTFELTGRHDALDCVACHAAADAPELAAGARRFLGAAQECVSCHEDAHEGRFGARCAGCHGQDAPFADAAGFDHSRFPLVDAHADVACESCHAAGPPAQGARAAVRECAACHDDPHGAAPLVLADSADCARCHDARAFAGTTYDAAAHAEHGVPLEGLHATAPCAGCHDPARLASDLAKCVTCHEDVHATGTTPPSWAASAACSECHDERGFRPTLADGASHDRFGGVLAAPHVEVGCADCHAGPSAPAVGDECAACHASPHAPDFTGADPCVACHPAADAAFLDAAPRLAAARHTGLALEQPHDIECALCHEPAAPFAERFPGRAPDDCAACHGDPHAGEFASGPFGAAGCLACHDATRFSPAAFSPEQHAATAFALDGAHAAVPCAACHAGEGAARRFSGLSAECAACHADPHGGTFDRPGLPASLDGRSGCARCHDTDGFRAAGSEFDHGRWTGRELVGAHARAGCGRCHERERGGALGAAPSACSACHADPHRGQLRRDDGTDCGRCHEQRESFTELRFDHARDTRFPLDADHAQLDCSACHRPVRIAGGETVILYRPLGTECRDCHLPSPGTRGTR